MSYKGINIEATIQKIREWVHEKSTREFNEERLHLLMQKPNWKETLESVTQFCKVEIVYE